MFTTAKTKLFGVFGYPVGHTMSPKLHSMISEKANKDIAYLAFEASPDDFGRKFEAAKELGASGLNITVPHKIRVMDYLDEIDSAAERIGAVNTVLEKDGKWYGFNTDGIGFLKGLEMNRISPEGKNILILGAGGGARAVAYALAEGGAESFSIEARTQEKADSIGKMIEKYTESRYCGLPRDNDAFDIIVNTTPLGMHPHEDKNPMEDFSRVTSDTVCCDLIYSPWETLFLQAAKKRGAKVLNGFAMLVFQGIFAFEHFMGEKLPDSFFSEIYDSFMNEFRK